MWEMCVCIFVIVFTNMIGYVSVVYVYVCSVCICVVVYENVSVVYVYVCKCIYL